MALSAVLCSAGPAEAQAVSSGRALRAGAVARTLASVEARRSLLQDAAPLLAPALSVRTGPPVLVEALKAQALAPQAAPGRAEAARIALAAAADPLIAGQVAAALSAAGPEAAGSPAARTLTELARGKASPELRAAAAEASSELGLDLGSFFDGGRGSFLEGFEPGAPPIADPGRFVVPNERHPKDLRPILERAPAGAYVTVGTERGFIAAAMAPAVSHLVLADIDPAVAAYNRTNVALLRLAGDRREYVRLRRRARREEWAALARAREPGLEPLLADAENFKAWRKYQQDNLSASPYSRARDAWFRFVRDRFPWPTGQVPGEEHRKPEFEDVNYLRDDALFARLKAMADRGHIRTVTMDLGEARSVDELTRALGASGAPLSVLDLSNVWDRAYLQARPVIRLVEAFAGIASPESLLVATEGGSAVVGYTLPEPWHYFGFRFGDVIGRVEESSRWIFGYTFRGYERNALNRPAHPDQRPGKPKYESERTRTYAWQEEHIAPPSASR